MLKNDLIEIKEILINLGIFSFFLAKFNLKNK